MEVCASVGAICRTADTCRVTPWAFPHTCSIVYKRGKDVYVVEVCASVGVIAGRRTRAGLHPGRVRKRAVRYIRYRRDAVLVCRLSTIECV